MFRLCIVCLYTEAIGIQPCDPIFRLAAGRRLLLFPEDCHRLCVPLPRLFRIRTAVRKKALTIDASQVTHGQGVSILGLLQKKTDRTSVIRRCGITAAEVFLRCPIPPFLTEQRRCLLTLDVRRAISCCDVRLDLTGDLVSF